MQCMPVFDDESPPPSDTNVTSLYLCMHGSTAACKLPPAEVNRNEIVNIVIILQVVLRRLSCMGMAQGS